VSQRAVEPNFPTRTPYRILGLLAMGITGRAAVAPPGGCGKVLALVRMRKRFPSQGGALGVPCLGYGARGSVEFVRALPRRDVGLEFQASMAPHSPGERPISPASHVRPTVGFASSSTRSQFKAAQLLKYLVAPWHRAKETGLLKTVSRPCPIGKGRAGAKWPSRSLLPSINLSAM
jgi:hypothetical protein